MDTSNEPQPYTPDAVTDAPSTEQDAPDQRPKNPRGKGRKGDRAAPRGEAGAMELALRRFQACGRCSYFVADCRIYYGRDTVRAAIENGPEEWLTLEWTEVMRRLVRESYIADDDVFYIYYDGTCPECHRRYTYISEPHEDAQPMFRLQY